MLEPDQMYPLHVALIMHGRRICIPRRPRCPGCPLLDLCPQVGVAEVADGWGETAYPQISQITQKRH